mmetsp:Transcript_33165/g.88071  ORF Transcript_33165/g.88071 Transcript_33165/m.88071 type:complete len:222 (+) Transcript_33165:302-967(+)
MPLRHVLVVAVELLALHVLSQRLHHAPAPLDVEREVVELLHPLRLVVYVQAAHEVLELAAQQPRHRAFHRGALHLLLEVVAQYAVQLLHVVLRERVERVPPEALGQLSGADARVGGLQAEEHPLQRESHRLVLPVAPLLPPHHQRTVRPRPRRLRPAPLRLLLRGHLVHSPPQRGDVVQGLQQRVHVARGALVLEPHVARLGLGVVDPGGGILEEAELLGL